jgi:hypothetical protein
MSAALSRTLSAVHGTFGEDAVYIPPAGAPVSGLRVMVLRETEADEAGGGTFVGKFRRIVEVTSASLPNPVRDGIFQLAGGQAIIVGDPQLKDKAGLVWTCLVRMGA